MWETCTVDFSKYFLDKPLKDDNWINNHNLFSYSRKKISVKQSEKTIKSKKNLLLAEC